MCACCECYVIICCTARLYSIAMTTQRYFTKLYALYCIHACLLHCIALSTIQGPRHAWLYAHTYCVSRHINPRNAPPYQPNGTHRRNQGKHYLSYMLCAVLYAFFNCIMIKRALTVLICIFIVLYYIDVPIWEASLQRAFMRQYLDPLASPDTNGFA
jgi:hypothetical protein